MISLNTSGVRPNPQLEKLPTHKQGFSWQQVWWVMKQELMLEYDDHPYFSFALRINCFAMIVIGVFLAFCIMFIVPIVPIDFVHSLLNSYIFLLLFNLYSSKTPAEVFFSGSALKLAILFRTIPLSMHVVAASRIIIYLFTSIFNLFIMFGTILTILYTANAPFVEHSSWIDLLSFCLFWSGYYLMINACFLWRYTNLYTRWGNLGLTSTIIYVTFMSIINIPLYFLPGIHKPEDIISWSLSLVHHNSWVAFLSLFLGFGALYGWYRLLLYRLTAIDYE